MSLLDYGFDLLENRKYLIENFNFKDPYDFVNKLFDDAYVNQSLTYDRRQAAQDVFMEYDIVSILETLNNMGYDNESIRNFSIEAIHVLLCANQFESYLSQHYENYKQYLSIEFTDQEILLLTLYTISVINLVIDAKNEIASEIYKALGTKFLMLERHLKESHDLCVAFNAFDTKMLNKLRQQDEQ